MNRNQISLTWIAGALIGFLVFLAWTKDAFDSRILIQVGTILFFYAVLWVLLKRKR
jgi:hypothetical protein